MPGFTATEQVVVDMLIRYSALHQEPSLGAIARECHVAKSTVVKTIQKLGFTGFKDYQYTYRLQSSIANDRLLPTRVVAGDLDKEAQRLADVFTMHQECKNLIYAGGRDLFGGLAAYMSRKLGMFDIFAPASYDYALADHMRLPAGFALFFPHGTRAPNGAVPAEDPLSIWAKEIAYFADRGMKAVLISDDAALMERLPAAERFALAPAPDGGSDDLMLVRALMLFERALERFAAREGRDHERA